MPCRALGCAAWRTVIPFSDAAGAAAPVCEMRLSGAARGASAGASADAASTAAVSVTASPDDGGGSKA